MMYEQTESALPNSFWVYSGAALVWNLIGLFIYYMFVTTPAAGNPAYTELQQSALTAMPSWATGAYGLAVTTGVLGSLFLLLRKSWAVPTFIVSLVAIIVQDYYWFIMADAMRAWGNQAAIMPSIVLLVAIALIFYSRTASAKGWLS